MPAGSCVGRFASTLRTGRPPLPGLRVCRDACSGFDAPRGPCIEARVSRTVHRSYADRFLRRSVRVDASAWDGPPDFVRAGMRVPDSVPREVRASGRVHRGPCIGAIPAGSCVGRFASTLPHGTAPPRTSCVPGCVFRIRCPARSVHRGPCIGGRAVQPVFRGRAVRIGCLPPRCGGGMRRSAPSLSDAGRDRSMTRETAETQRTERAVARNGRIRFGDGAVRFAVGRMGPKRARLRLGRSEYGACRS